MLRERARRAGLQAPHLGRLLGQLLQERLERLGHLVGDASEWHVHGERALQRAARQRFCRAAPQLAPQAPLAARGAAPGALAACGAAGSRAAESEAKSNRRFATGGPRTFKAALLKSATVLAAAWRAARHELCVSARAGGATPLGHGLFAKLACAPTGGPAMRGGEQSASWPSCVRLRQQQRRDRALGRRERVYLLRQEFASSAASRAPPPPRQHAVSRAAVPAPRASTAVPPHVHARCRLAAPPARVFRRWLGVRFHLEHRYRPLRR